jgi:hypothetical protein
MFPRLMKLAVVIISTLLLMIYLYLNINKIESISRDWINIEDGQPALELQLELAGEKVYQQRLKTSEIFDADGVRQIYFIHLPKRLFARTRAGLESASLTIQQQETALTLTKNPSALLAVTEDKRVYLLEEGELRYMMTVIWNERLRSGTIVQCATPRLCKSLAVDSRDWGPVQGPFLDSEYLPERRGLPKGRWAKGPETVLRIQSGSRQRAVMQINLLGVLEDQQVRFRGAATGVQKVDKDMPPVLAAGRELYPAIYLLQLDLQPGANYLEMSFSGWLEPGAQGANTLAAYVVAIGMKESD